MTSRQSLVLGALILCSVAAWRPVHAHDWYIQAVDYALPQPGAATLFQGWGHKVPLDGALAGEKIAHLRLLAPDGTAKDLSVTPGRSFHVMNLDLPNPGVYTLLGESVPGYYHIYRDKAGKVHHSTQPLDELKDIGQIFFSCRAFQAPKTYLLVGEAKAAPAPVGSGLEIVPDQPTGSLRAGDCLTYRVLMDGKPVSEGVTVDATYMGYSSAPEDYLFKERKVVDGKGQFDLPCAGVWYVRVHLRIPAPAEFKPKCQDYLYNATLTLEVGEKEKKQERVTQDD